MRRWLLFALLFVLPLQFAWSAAAAYCAHEAAPAKSHLGHHTHEHKGDAGDSSAEKLHAKASTAKAGKLMGDNDCGYCHLSFAKPMLPLALQFDTDVHFSVEVAPSQAFDSRGPDHHDRPNWRLA
ncbi:MAG: DUF2946 domain-containing protein [Roseateles sp.]|nr:MAG: DUF2946 domain-containing protein [Roseateles sp.]